MIGSSHELLARLPQLALAAGVLLLAACAVRQPTAADVDAKRFEPVAGKAVIYLVRDPLDFSDDATGITLDGNLMGTTYRGTYFRWTLPPGRHDIAGFAGDSGFMTVDTEAGRIYYVQQSATRTFGWVRSYFTLVPENTGRAVVRRSELIASQ
jgi:hypothetical protein